MNLLRRKAHNAPATDAVSALSPTPAPDDPVTLDPNGEPTMPTVEDFLPFFSGKFQRKMAETARKELLDEVRAGYIDYYREINSRAWVIERQHTLGDGRMTIKDWVYEWDGRREYPEVREDLAPGARATWRWRMAERYRESRPDLCGAYNVTIVGPSSVAPGLIDCRDERDDHVFQAQPEELTLFPEGFGAAAS